jgi:SHS2 domain-containing protein
LKDFEQLPHTADIKIRVYGITLQEFFRHGVIGMFQVIGPKIIGAHQEHGRVSVDHLSIRHEVEIKSIDLDALLVDFLSELLYLSDVYNEAYLDAIIHDVNETHIKATILGAKVIGFEVVEIKAVTYHGLHVQKIEGIWQADIVFDI